MGCRTVFGGTENGHLMLTLGVVALQRRRPSKRVMVEGPVRTLVLKVGFLNRRASLIDSSGSAELGALHLSHQSRTAFFVFHANPNFDRSLGSVPVQTV